MGREHLRPPWKPGQSGNPKGWPKGRPKRTFQSEILKALDEIKPGTRKTMREQLVAVACRRALQGNPKFLEMLMERADGKVPSRFDINIDTSTLTDEQVERIANGEDPNVVLATSGPGGVGETPTTDG